MVTLHFKALDRTANAAIDYATGRAVSMDMRQIMVDAACLMAVYSC